MTATFSAAVLDLICSHLSLDADELIVESTTDDVQAITSRWHEFSRNLSHLPRSERQQVLQRTRPFTPVTVDGVQVTLFEAVQVAKGKTRVSAAIVDDGSTRSIIMGC